MDAALLAVAEDTHEEDLDDFPFIEKLKAKLATHKACKKSSGYTEYRKTYKKCIKDAKDASKNTDTGEADPRELALDKSRDH